MSDFSRSSFDPDDDFFLLEHQQGRAFSDDDLNAGARIIDRRLRASDYDLAGLAPIDGIDAIAAVPMTTPDAFLVHKATKPGMNQPGIYLGPGRMYVDGILVENHGTLPAWDTSLEEWAGTWGCDFAEQRWFPGESLPGDGTHFVYLVAALRTADALLEPGIVDPAFDLDTTVRRQVVWAVRSTPITGGRVEADTPDADVPGFADLIPPSSGRLTTRTVDPPDDDDVCVLPPEGHYRGRDNQFFRVQIVESGTLGKARILVSRENASVRTLAVHVAGDTVARVASVGRDDVLSFSEGDVVQVLSEEQEREWVPNPRSSGGTFSRIADVNREKREITLEGPAFAAFVGLSSDELAERKVRVIRWEVPERLYAEDGTDITQSNLLDDGTILVDSTPIRIEGGIVLAFSDAGGPGFLIGDSWSFAARYRDHSVEELDAAMPDSLHRHWTRLGRWNGGQGTFDDWRRHVPQPGGGTTPPDDCTCCEIKISPSGQADQQIIQDAIAEMDARGGGVVVLCPGAWSIDEPVVLSGVERVIVRGSGPATELRAAREVFILQRCSELRFEDFRTLTGTPVSHIVVGDSSHGIHLLRVGCFALREEIAEEIIAGRGAAALVAVNGIVQLLTIERCALQGSIGVGTWLGGRDDIPLREMHSVHALEVGRTRIGATVAGIRLDATVLLAGDIDVRSCVIESGGSGIEILGADAGEASLQIEDNTVGAVRDGIAVGGLTATIAGNDVRTRLKEEAGDRATGILIGDSRVQFAERAVRLSPPGAGAIAVHDNHVAGFVFGVRATRRTLALEIADNTIERAAFGVVVAGRAGAAGIRSNTIRTLIPAREQSAFGIVAVGTEAIEITGNQIDGALPDAYSRRLDEEAINTSGYVQPGIVGAGLWTGGIIAQGAREIRVTENRVRNVLALEGSESAIGIRISGPYAAAVVSDNTVHPLFALQPFGPGPFEGFGETWQALVIGDAGDRRGLFAAAGFDGGPTVAGVASALADLGDARRVVFAANLGWIVDDDMRDREIAVHDNVFSDVFPTPTRERERPDVGVVQSRAVPVVSVHASGEIEGSGFTGVLRFVGNGVRLQGLFEFVYDAVLLQAEFATASANTIVYGELVLDVPARGTGYGTLARGYADLRGTLTPSPFDSDNPTL